MKNLCNKKSPIGVIGPVFHSVFVGQEAMTFLDDFKSPLIKRFKETVMSKITGYSLQSLRVIRIPNMTSPTKKVELVAFFKRNGKNRKDKIIGMKRNYEYMVFHFTFNRKIVMAYGTDHKDFVDNFPVESSPYFTLPSYEYDYRNSGGYHQFLTKPVSPAYKFLAATHNTVKYYNETEAIEVAHLLGYGRTELD